MAQRNGTTDRQSLAQVQKRPAEYEEDRHAIVIDPVNGKLYEFFTFGKTSAGWAAGQASIFNLRSNELRPTAGPRPMPLAYRFSSGGTIR